MAQQRHPGELAELINRLTDEYRHLDQTNPRDQEYVATLAALVRLYEAPMKERERVHALLREALDNANLRALRVADREVEKLSELTRDVRREAASIKERSYLIVDKIEALPDALRRLVTETEPDDGNPFLVEPSAWMPEDEIPI